MSTPPVAPPDPSLPQAVAASGDAHRRQSTAAHRARWGQFFTPAAVAELMASWWVPPPGPRPVRILDPGAGVGALGVAAALQIPAEQAAALVSVEPEPTCLETLHRHGAALHTARPRIKVTVVAADFLDDQVRSKGPLGAPFDLVIANPPYFKTSPRDPRGGRAPNAYARFMDMGLDLLREGGSLIAIVPRSFMSGWLFRRFRARLRTRATLVRVHHFTSRRTVFSAARVLQETVIVHYIKGGHQGPVTTSASRGPDDLPGAPPIAVDAGHLFATERPDSPICLPTSPGDLALLQRVQSWTQTLDTLGVRVSTGPVVPFRCRPLLRHDDDGPTIPLLWMHHVREGQVRWPRPAPFTKPQWLQADAPPALQLAPANYVLTRRFSAPEDARRLQAAPLLQDAFGGTPIGLENHLNYLHRPEGMPADLALGLWAVLQSNAADRYLRMLSGNTQVNAADLRALPMPTEATLRRLGRASTPGAVDAALGIGGEPSGG